MDTKGEYMQKKIVFMAVLASILGFGENAFAGTLYAPEHTCAELQRIVAEQGPIGIQSRFGYAIYSSTTEACSGYMGGVGIGIVTGTMDTAHCNVGYTCLENHGGDGNG